MILIISKEGDIATNKVIDWLIYYNYEFVRINDKDDLELSLITINNEGSNIRLKKNGKLVDFNKIQAVWYRKEGINFNDRISASKFKKHKIKEYEENELSKLKEFVEKSLFNTGNVLGTSIINKEPNKLEVLKNASNIGLNIPDTIISSNIRHIRGRSYITKAMGNVLYAYLKWFPRLLITYTEEVKDECYNDSLRIFPSLFQEKIEKQYELRIFHILGKNYPMAIFSQKNSKTETDFRKYDNAKPNRCVPYLLPNELELKLNALMSKLNYDTGSIDMLVDKSGRYYFLEVNPVGQFGMTSLPCNYNLEKIIAQTLIKLSLKNE